jgi:hypothetical protein
MSHLRTATALLLVAAGGLTACGSSRDTAPEQPAAAPPARTAPTVSTPARTSGSVVASTRKDPVASAPRTVHAAKPTKADRSETDTSTAGDPCRLVTRSEARAIVGGRVAAPQTAPLGPTCIYRAARAQSSVTLSVMRMNVASATKRDRSVIQASVAGHRAYCVKAGGLRMLVPLTGGKVLTVGAPCPIAARFATRALVRVGR